MTTTYKIKAYSRCILDDGNTLSRYEYNGSFQANEMDIHRAFNEHDIDVLYSWSKMMDCFFDALFIRVDTDETVSFDKYAQDLPNNAF